MSYESPQELPVRDGDEERVRPLDELRSSGVLWYINRVCFHPRGYALALAYGGAGEVIGWNIEGDGSEIWSFTASDDDAKFAKIKELLGG